MNTRSARPTVSVVIPTHNYAGFVGEAIESALGQTVPPLEVIVVDDGSTDDTPHVLESFGNRIRAVRQRNQGVCAARNAGASIATGDLLAFLDADDVWLPDKLEKQIECFLAHPNTGLVHCGIVHVDATGKPMATIMDGMEGDVAIDILMCQRNVILGGGSAMLVSRAAFHEVGAFDTSLTHAEDWDLWYRLARRYRVGFVREVLVRYRLHEVNVELHCPNRVPTLNWCRKTERAVFHVCERAFAEGDPQLLRLRPRIYSNVHLALAGFYFAAKQPHHVAKHLASALWLEPRNVLRLVGYPVRALRRRRSARLSAIAAASANFGG